MHLGRFWKSAYARASVVIGRDVQLVVDVALSVEARRDHGVDRLVRGASGIGSCRSNSPVTGSATTRALVADDGIVEAGRRARYGRTDRNIRPVTTMTCVPAAAAACERGARPRPQDERLADQRAVEVARERARRAAGSLPGALRLAARRLDDVGGDVGDLLVGELALERRHRAAPIVTWAVARRQSGLAWSRFGPTVPVAFASASVWQPVQPRFEEERLAGGWRRPSA